MFCIQNITHIYIIYIYPLWDGFVMNYHFHLYQSKLFSYVDTPCLVIVPLHHTYIIETFKLYIIEELKEEKVVENLINGFIKIPLVHSSL